GASGTTTGGASRTTTGGASGTATGGPSGTVEAASAGPATVASAAAWIGASTIVVDELPHASSPSGTTIGAHLIMRSIRPPARRRFARVRRWPMIAIVWSFRVEPGRVGEFEDIYGAAGAWAQLFARSAGYLGSELLRQPGGRYLTIDRWRAQADHDAFKAQHGDDYHALDRRCEELTADEQAIGVFEVC